MFYPFFFVFPSLLLFSPLLPSSQGAQPGGHRGKSPRNRKFGDKSGYETHKNEVFQKWVPIWVGPGNTYAPPKQFMPPRKNSWLRRCPGGVMSRGLHVRGHHVLRVMSEGHHIRKSP